MFFETHSICAPWDYERKRPYKKDTLGEDRRIYVHLFFNPERAVEEETAFNSFVPCHDKLTNVSGLYDIVTGKFYGCVNANKKGERLEEGPHVGNGLVIKFR